MAGLSLWIARIRSMSAVIELGRRRAGKGDGEGAEEAFRLAAASRDPRHNIRGALHLWILRSERGDLRGADEAYLRAAGLAATGALGRDEPAAERSLGLGSHIAAYQREFVRPARLAYGRGIDSGDPESAPLAAMGLAGLDMQELEETYGAAGGSSYMAALRFAAGSGHPDHAPVAAGWLATCGEQNGDVDAARFALRVVMSAGDAEKACHAALAAGKLFKREGHPDEAVTALRFVVDNSRTGLVQIAAQHLGELLAERGDADGARAAYQVVLDRSTFPHVIAEVRAALDRL